jgi:glycosyltransferase involved in cell wall biosynthesis
MPKPENVSVLGKKAGFSFATVLRLKKLIARVRPDLIHTHNLGPLIYGSLAANLAFSYPILHGEHSQLTEEECSRRRLAQRRLLYLCCNKIHTVSSGLRRQLIGLGFTPSKITVITNGVDVSHFSPGDRAMAKQNIGLPADALVLGIVGRFGPHKRHSVLIEAFRQISDQFPSAHLLIVGDGPERTKIHEQSKLSHLGRRIRLTGFQNDTRPYYRAMDLLVVPSVNEGLSNALIEAMACGVPALAHRACGNDEVITDGTDGFLADLSTPVKLHDELRRVLSDRTRLILSGSNAREKILASFPLHRMVAEYDLLYRQLTAPPT